MSKALSTRQRTFLDQLLRLEAVMAAPAPDTEAPLEDFRRVIMKRWDNIRWRLLGTTADKLRRLSDAQRALLQLLQESPDLLAPLERQRDEVSHTRLIAWFLEQDDRVGQACRCALAEELGIAADLTVQAEVEVASGCRVDLVLETPQELVYIEAKIEAAERSGQLRDYLQALVANAGKRRPLLVFLTMNEVSEASAEHVRLSFEQLLILWLPAALLRGPTASYLASYLVTVAHDLCGVIEPGHFPTWSLVRQHRTLDLLLRVNVPDA